MLWHDRLNDTLSERGWNKRKLAAESGVSYHNVVKYCGGSVDNPRLGVVERLATALKVDPVWLQTGRGPAGEHVNAINAGDENETHPYQPDAFDLAEKVAHQWEPEIFGEPNIIAHTRLVTHLYHYIIRNGIKSVTDPEKTKAAYR